MYTKIFVVLCLAYFFMSMANSNDMKINELFKEISGGNDHIIYSDLSYFFKDDDPIELRRIMKECGTHIENEEYRMDFEQFEKAVKTGHIPKLYRSDIDAVYRALIPKDVNRDYIILEDLVAYYCGKKYNWNISRVKKIMDKFGEPIDKQLGIKYPALRRALNLGYLPAPTPL